MSDLLKASRFSPAQVVVATLLGGILAGVMLVALDLLRDKRWFAAWACLATGLLSGPVLLLLALGGNPMILLSWWEGSWERLGFTSPVVGLRPVLATWIVMALAAGSAASALGAARAHRASWTEALLAAGLGLATLTLLMVGAVLAALAVAFATGR